MAFSTLTKVFPCILFVLFYYGNAAPTGTVRVRLYSDESAAYIKANCDPTTGTVDATASSSDEEGYFYMTSPGFGWHRFESYLYSGNFLMIENGELKCGMPMEGSDSDVFEVIPIFGQRIAYRKSKDCYIAFDSEGEVHGPCIADLDSGSTETHIRVAFN